jgi:hypothetical protein
MSAKTKPVKAWAVIWLDDGKFVARVPEKGPRHPRAHPTPTAGALAVSIFRSHW